MFGKVASDMMGLSDIGTIVSPSEYHMVDSDDYVMHEDGEKIYFLIKSKSDEYCFTNKALIHLDGTSAMNKKRMLKRYSYKHNNFRNVRLETAGNLDKDVEIKFYLGDVDYSIDVDKKQLEKLKDLYKALVKIGSMQYDNDRMLEMSESSLSSTVQTLSASRFEMTDDLFKKVNEYAFDWQKDRYLEFNREDFGEIYEKFINE
ncbi:PH domain-containing protein [Algivirga pacifica]|uniref:PH domain-containing protein n=1 Tax=Algivirga pacifica TaxID=1162670 RepID=A0ABP9D8E3_9BACT